MTHQLYQTSLNPCVAKQMSLTSPQRNPGRCREHHLQGSMNQTVTICESEKALLVPSPPIYDSLFIFVSWKSLQLLLLASLGTEWEETSLRPRRQPNVHNHLYHAFLSKTFGWLWATLPHWHMVVAACTEFWMKGRWWKEGTTILSPHR